MMFLIWLTDQMFAVDRTAKLKDFNKWTVDVYIAAVEAYFNRGMVDKIHIRVLVD